VSLKESGTRIYKTDSKRDPMDSVFLLVPPSAAVEAAADDKIFYESQELLEQNILEANEEIEVLKRETAENATTISRTDSESERRMCLENNRSLKDRLYHADLRLNKLWKDLKILFENRAESHFLHMLDDINRAAVILSTGSKAVIESHVQDWKIARSENVKEKTGIQLCLDKVSQSKRSPVIKSDISYRKTLIEKLVETESQIRDYNTRIQKAKDILRHLQMQAPPPPKDPFVDDNPDYWNRQTYGRSRDNSDTPDSDGRPPVDSRKKIIPSQKYSSSSSQQPSSYETTATRPKSQNSVTYRDEPKTYQSSRMGASLQPRQPPPVPRKPDNPLPKMTTTKYLREKLANKQVGLVWNPPHFETLPEQVSLWDGRNTRNPPKWATKKASILEITNKVNFWVKNDF
jgi:hypothetical protein